MYSVLLKRATTFKYSLSVISGNCSFFGMCNVSEEFLFFVEVIVHIYDGVQAKKLYGTNLTHPQSSSYSAWRGVRGLERQG